jgi:hypothetical protein
MTIGDIATAIITGSSALLGLSALILVTIRLSNFKDTKERVSRRDYNRLYDWTFASFVFGCFSVAIMLLFLCLHLWMLSFISGLSMAFQLASLFFAIVWTLWPPKWFEKNQRSILKSTNQYNKQIKKYQKLDDNQP